MMKKRVSSFEAHKKKRKKKKRKKFAFHYFALFPFFHLSLSFLSLSPSPFPFPFSFLPFPTLFPFHSFPNLCMMLFLISSFLLFSLQGRIVMVTKEEKLPYDRPTLSKAPGTPADKMTLRDEAFFKVRRNRP